MKLHNWSTSEVAHILTETGTRITTGNVYLMWYKTGDKGTRRTTQFGETARGERH